MGEKTSHPNIAKYLVDASTLHPNATAVISAKAGQFNPRSFQQLFEEVGVCSYLFKNKGISEGDKVLLAVKPGYQLILIAFALFQIGAVPVIIDPGMGVKSFIKCVRNTQPDALIGLPLIHIIKKFFPKTFRTIKKSISIQNHTFLSTILQNKEHRDKNFSSPGKEQIAAIVFTSGSTGPPKGVCYTHKMFNAQINHLKNNFGLESGEKDLSTLPVFALFNPALGITSVIPDMNPRKPAKADPKKLVYAMQEFEINTAFASPIIGRKIFSFCKINNITLPKVKRLMLAGAPTNPKLVINLNKYLPNGNVILPYGATEALPISAIDQNQIIDLENEICRGKGSCLGKPLKGNFVKIMPITSSPFESGENCPKELKVGETGEICIAGQIASKKYYRMPGANIDSKFNDGEKDYHRMGDLGYFDQNGLLRFLGRKAERIITKNGPLETERCEPIVNAINGVFRSALIGIETGNLQEPCLVVELDDKKTNKIKIKSEILEKLNTFLPNYQIKHIVFEISLPVDKRHNAKIHRLALSKKWTKRFKHASSLTS